MTIFTLCLYIGVISAFLTFAMIKWSNVVKSPIISFLQNFCGILFIFSGWVKAVDPMGTAYKMEEYFGEFANTAHGSFLKFMEPVFPFLAEYAIGFSVFMIVLEIVIGIMLLIGYLPRWTSMLFFLIMIFFTILTGYTFLTGYVPSDANFFEFGKWGSFLESNMRVKNCGCFGDFLKLTPDISFKKDVFLMIPSILFLLNWKKFHQLFSFSLRTALTGFATFGLLLFCMANYKWDEPVIDFRPFKNGADIRSQKEAESKAQSSVEIESWKLKNRSSGEMKIVSNSDYMKNISSYPKSEWEVVDQIKTVPSIPITKISDFALFDLTGSEVTEDILAEPRSRVMINIPKLYYTSRTEINTVQDTVWKTDTIQDLKLKTTELTRSIAEIKEKKIKKNVFTWDNDFKKIIVSTIQPFLDSVYQDSVKAFYVVGGVSEDALQSLFSQLNISLPVYTADNILLKTIMRSNPGVILWRNGKIIHKWHYTKLPDLNEMRRDYLDWSAPLIH